MKKRIIKLIVALALFAGVFVCNTAFAEPFSNWNVRLSVD